MDRIRSRWNERLAMHSGGPLLGVLGGMGPLATADFLARLVRLSDAVRDQDHCRAIVYSNPRVPDRSDAVLHLGPSPLPGLLAGIAMLERCDVEAIVIPCNTAHYWLGEIARATPVPIISIVDAVVAELLDRRLASGRVGILGTAGMIRSGIYQRGLAALGYDVVVPCDPDHERGVETAIRSIKAGDLQAASPLLEAAIADLEERNCDAVVLGCTELPLVFTAPHSTKGTLVVDSTESLAKACLAWAAGREQAVVVQEGARSSSSRGRGAPVALHVGNE